MYLVVGVNPVMHRKNNFFFTYKLSMCIFNIVIKTVFTLSHKLLLSSCRSRTRISSSARTGKSLSKLHLIKNKFFYPLNPKLLYIGYKKQMILTFIVSLCIAHNPAPNRVLCYSDRIWLLKIVKFVIRVSSSLRLISYVLT